MFKPILAKTLDLIYTTNKITSSDPENAVIGRDRVSHKVGLLATTKAISGQVFHPLRNFYLTHDAVVSEAIPFLLLPLCPDVGGCRVNPASFVVDSSMEWWTWLPLG